MFATGLQRTAKRHGARIARTYLNACAPLRLEQNFRQYNISKHIVRSASTSDFIQFEHLVELQQKSVVRFGDDPFLGTRNGDKFDWMTYREFDVAVQRFRNVLQHHGVGFDDKVAIISNNRTEWAVIAYATMGMGGQIVPMYEAQLEKDWIHIITDSDSKLVVGATQKIYDKIQTYPGKIGKVTAALCLDAASTETYSYAHWIDKVVSEPPVPTSDRVTGDHLSTIIYTSGTTGVPKGVQLSHSNLAKDAQGIPAPQHKYMYKQRSTAFLPWAHVFGMVCELHAGLMCGSSIGIVPSREQILECIQIVQPTVMMSVPALFNRVFDAVSKQVAAGSAVKRSLFDTAMRTARKRNDALEFGRPVGTLLELQFKFFDKLVLSKVRAKIGKNLRFMGAGGAATSLPVLQFFEDIGIPICEGYGLTETSPMITFSTVPYEGRRLGCVGTALKDVDLRIIDPSDMSVLPADTEGEVVCAGPIVMQGYRNNEKANAEVFFQLDGKKFFRTGDLGKLVEGKFLKITGRIKEQFKLENGKFVVPAPLEDRLCRSSYIAQVFACGQNKPFVVALVVPDPIEIAAWAKAQNLPAMPALLDTLEFKTLIAQELARTGLHAKSYERPLVWTAIAEPFTQENQMSTPKLSLRRPNIHKAFDALIDEMYEIGTQKGQRAGATCFKFDGDQLQAFTGDTAGKSRHVRMTYSHTSTEE